jgi:hypothetical protein
VKPLDPTKDYVLEVNCKKIGVTNKGGLKIDRILEPGANDYLWVTEWCVNIEDFNASLVDREFGVRSIICDTNLEVIVEMVDKQHLLEMIYDLETNIFRYKGQHEEFTASRIKRDSLENFVGSPERIIDKWSSLEHYCEGDDISNKKSFKETVIDTKVLKKKLRIDGDIRTIVIADEININPYPDLPELMMNLMQTSILFEDNLKYIFERPEETQDQKDKQVDLDEPANYHIHIHFNKVILQCMQSVIDGSRRDEHKSKFESRKFMEASINIFRLNLLINGLEDTVSCKIFANNINAWF